VAFGYAVYFTERAKNRVVRWDPNSQETDIVAGDSGGDPDQALAHPYGLAFAPSGALLVADKLHHRVCRVQKGRLSPISFDDIAGTRVPQADSPRAYNPVLQCPTGLYMEPEGTLLCTFADDGTIYRIHEDGNLEHLIGILPRRPFIHTALQKQVPADGVKDVRILVPTGIIRRKNGDIVFIERIPQIIRCYSPEAGLRCLFPRPVKRPSSPARIVPERTRWNAYVPSYPGSLVEDAEGTLYIAEAEQGCVLRLDERNREVVNVLSVRRPEREVGWGVAAMAFAPDGTAWILNTAEGVVEAYSPSVNGPWKALGVRLAMVRGEALQLPPAGSGIAIGA
jgi:sugar lactone lactonase YvrE